MSLPPHIIRACRQDFAYFCRYILDQKLGACHAEIVRELEEGNKDLLVMMARGHFKTWIASRAFVLWKLWHTPKEKSLVIGLETSNMTQTQYIIEELIIGAIEKNDILKKDIKPDDIYHAKWSARMIKTKKGHSVIAVPFGRKGYHFDYLISDDLQQESDNSSANVSIDAIKKTFWNSSWPMTQSRRGKHVVIGTPITLDDLYSEFDEKPDWKCLRYPAVITAKNGDWISPQFPEHFDMDQLKKIKNNSPPWSWQSEYMLDPVGSGTSVFPSEDIRLAMLMEKPDLSGGEESGVRYYSGWDIALSQKEGADYSAFVVVGFVPGKPMWVENYWHGKFEEDEQMKRAIEFHCKYGLSKMVVEQKGLGYSLAHKANKDPQLATSKELFDTNHTNKTKLIGDLSLVIHGKMLALRGFKKIAAELGTFGIKTKKGLQTFEALSGHDDLVMALAMAVYAAGGWLPKKNPVGSMEAI